jgi:hypothetical protein
MKHSSEKFQHASMTATIVIERYGDGYRASDDSGQLLGLEDDAGGSYWPITDPDLLFVYDRALEVASELRRTEIDPRTGDGECYSVDIDDRTEDPT